MNWKYFDMFSGIGGFHLGLSWAGFQFDKVYYSDIDKYANKIYALRFPGAVPLGDVTKIDPKAIGPLDVVTAGFPCQDLSCAGKQRGIHAKRSGLFNQIIRISRVCKPKYIILENVPALISRNDWAGYVFGQISEIGYNAEWEIISAADLGAPHLRKRIWIVAYAKGDGKKRPQSQNRQGGGPLLGCEKERARKTMAHTYGNGSNKRYNSQAVKKDSAKIQRGQNKQDKKNEGAHFVARNNGSSRPWAIEPGLGRMAHGIPDRVDRLKCLGNSIVPQIAELIGQRILENEIYLKRLPGPGR